jgi:tRNA-modifying protein YgfZ
MDESFCFFFQKEALVLFGLAGDRARNQVRLMTHVAPLPDRGVVAVAGPDRVAFLQGLVSNDVEQAVPGRAVWAALLTPQGKWLADFFILTDGERLLLDVERGQVAGIVQKLGRFRLRSRVTLADLSAEWQVFAAWDGVPEVPPGAVAAPDPRLPEAGWRLLAPGPVAADATADAWDAHRLALGLPDGSRDLEADKTVLLEAGFDELGGVSWSKGCYMGQELTARTKYRGLIKRRLVRVAVEGALPPPGTPVLRDGVEVGTMRSGRDGTALATLRLDALGAALSCGGVRLVPRPPDWMRLPEGLLPEGLLPEGLLPEGMKQGGVA